MSKNYLDFIDNYEKGLDEFIRTESREIEEQPKVIQEKKVVPKVVPKPIQKTIVKESSTTFSYCTSCGQKSPYVKGGIFCTFCGRQSLKNTASQPSVKEVHDDVDHASSILDDEPMESSRIFEYLSKQNRPNPSMDAIRQQQVSQPMMETPISEATSHACDLLDETPEMSVKLLEMPDFSKFMPQQAKQEISQPSVPEIQSNLQIGDDDVQKQMQALGLI